MAILTNEEIERRLGEFYAYQKPRAPRLPRQAPKRLSVPQAAEYLHVPPWVIEFLIEMRQLRTYRGHKGRKVEPQDVDHLRPYIARIRAAAEAWRDLHLEPAG